VHLTFHNCGKFSTPKLYQNSLTKSALDYTCVSTPTRQGHMASQSLSRRDTQRSVTHSQHMTQWRPKRHWCSGVPRSFDLPTFSWQLLTSMRNVNKHGRHQHSTINIRQLSATKNTIPHNQRLQILAEMKWKRGQDVGRTSIPSHSNVATADFRCRRSAKAAVPYDSVRRHRKRNSQRRSH